MSSPIGVFDSGVGGLSVLAKIESLLPGQEIIYFGDTARLPYGEKSRETIVRYAVENGDFLASFAISFLVVACHTASCYAFDVLKGRYDFPVFNVVDPAVERAFALCRNGKIALLATRATVHSGVYERKIKELDRGVKLFSQACPLFVPFVEEGLIDHPATELIVREYLRPIRESGADTLIFGCTHYPMLAPLIKRELGERISLVDPAVACAETIASAMGRSEKKALPSGAKSSLFYVSDDPEKFLRVGERFLGRPIQKVVLSTAADDAKDLSSII